VPVKSDIYLRRADRSDLDAVVAWMEDEDFQHFLYGDAARSPRQIREQIVTMLGRSATHTTPAAVYLLIDSPAHGPIGLVSLQQISWRNRHCALDVYIGNKRFRNGITAGMSTFRALEYSFEELNLHRVQAYIYAFNRASWRTFELSGAVRELVMPQHVARNGELHDVYGYGLLRSDFEAFRAKYGKVDGLPLADMIRDLPGEEAEAGT